MNEKAAELFDELLQYHHRTDDMQKRYAALYSLLDRLAKELTAEYAAEYTSLFARLYALCRQEKYPHITPIELFRSNARRVMRGEYAPEEADYLYDLKALCEFISWFFHEPVPAAIRKMLPDGWRAFRPQEYTTPLVQKIRFVVESWDDTYIYGHAENDPGELQQRVDYHIGEGIFACLPDQLYTGAQVNLLEVKTENGTEQTFHPRIIVLEPDFLIDVSSLSACLQTYGNTPENYLINKLQPNPATRHTLLGNAANQFLDDCVNETAEQPADFTDSIRRNFRDYLLEYSVCPDINRQFFTDAQVQFQHIRKTVQQKFGDASVDIEKHLALLEPSFFCEALGLQGRMDLLLNDLSRIIELKSGKAEEYRGPIRGRQPHNLQMALYREILHYCMDKPRDAIHTYLFYSHYPHLFEQRSALTPIQQAIALRNAIVHQERQLRDGQGLDLLLALTPERLNINQTTGKLWKEYQRPQLEAFLAPFHRVSSLEATYFNHFLQFVEREQFLAKTGDGQPDSGRGFAETWNADLLTKQANGNILTGLTICDFEEERGIRKIRLNLPTYDEGFLPNFREGDYVILYERNTEHDTAINHIVHRGCIESITGNELLLKLNYRQRNPVVFPRESHYALEHDHMDSSFTTLYRGLYAFLTAPQERRDLLLGQRPPRTDRTINLLGDYRNAVTNRVVLEAKQAQDYFLLVGPPGTGKTSIALRAMVKEFYADPNNQILLLSYTNRAVDEICSMLDNITPAPPYLRIGGEQNCDPAFRSHLMKNQAKECSSRQDILALLARHRIIVGTVSSISGQAQTLFQLKRFHVAIIDEASQILEPHLLGLLSACTPQGRCGIAKFILVGDHKQLPAVVTQRPEHSAVADERLRAIGLTDRRNSLFERLYTRQLQQPVPRIADTLLRQGRMHPEVEHFPSIHFYQGRLKPVPLHHQQEPLEFIRHGGDLQEYVATTRFGFLHCDPSGQEENNKSNRGEARIAAALVGTIHALCQLNNLPFDAAHRIGIIVPFRGQIAMIRQELRTLNLPETDAITIDTVERFQGSQRDIIIFSATISQPYQLAILSAPVEIDGQWVDRKLNVALTRARKQMFTIGNARLLARNPLYKELIEATQ